MVSPRLKVALSIFALIFTCLPALAQMDSLPCATTVENATNGYEGAPQLSYDLALAKYIDDILAQKKNPLELGVNEKGMPTYTPTRTLPEDYVAAPVPEKDWFEKSNWEIMCSVVKEKVSEKMGYVYLNVEYYEMDSDSAAYHPFYMAVIFSKTDKGWSLFHEQCVCVCKCACKPGMSFREQIIAELDQHVSLEPKATTEEKMPFEAPE